METDPWKARIPGQSRRSERKPDAIERLLALTTSLGTQGFHCSLMGHGTPTRKDDCATPRRMQWAEAFE